ncbi:MAG: GTPase HflX, partial [Gemmatimonadetes bacterium]|nr:GTPase HflX [Gemmatimonadota bacterium]
MSRDLIDLVPPQERAILVGAPLKRTNARHAAVEHLEELGRLADTAGARVVGTLTQLIDRPDSSTYIGKGKVQELKDMLTEHDATVVIFDDELSPAQGKNLEGELGKRVIDRAELILDIFALRAKSAEAKMQVELAQLEYSLPRLRNMWTHLEKFRGGIGVRGPGETQLETDRRLVGQRIAVLKERLIEVQKSREVQRKNRRNAFRVALVGYTNAGKSSLLRALVRHGDRPDQRADGTDTPGLDIVVEDRLFATLDPLTRDVSLGTGATPLVVTDTVGFIRKLPHHLVASFRATLEEVREADLLLHVIDSENPAWEEHRLVVDEVLDELGVHDRPVLHVFNKTDALEPESLAAITERMTNLLPGSVFASAVAPGGADSLVAALRAASEEARPLLRLRVPAAQGKLLAEIHRTSQVVAAENDEETGDVLLTVRADAAERGRWEQAGVVG